MGRKSRYEVADKGVKVPRIDTRDNTVIPNPEIHELEKEAAANQQRRAVVNAENIRRANQPVFSQYNGPRRTDEEIQRGLDAYKWKQTKQNIIRPVLKVADVATDAMQLGHFIPHPIAQSIAEAGDVAGAGIDALQAADAFREGNYRDAAINAASGILPLGLEAKTFRRNSKFVQPGELMYPLSPQAAARTTLQKVNTPRTEFLEPFKRTVDMKPGQLTANRVLLGAVGAETAYDTQQFGGHINNTDMKKNSKKPCYGCGGKMMEHGGPHNPPGMYWNGERYVEAKGSGTYNNGVYFAQGGPTDFPGYYPPKQQPGYWKVVSPWDSGVLGNVQYGGYITPPMDYQPQILKETNGQRHMGMGGNYIPVSINTPMGYGGYMPAPADDDTQMGQGGYIPASINYHPEILKETNGQRHMGQGGYYQTHNLWEDQGHIAEIQDGGLIEDSYVPGAPMFKKGGNWIQGAVNPAHKGYCTPMTKKTCTPRRKAFAKTMKKHHGFHEYGGPVQYPDGGAFRFDQQGAQGNPVDNSGYAQQGEGNFRFDQQPTAPNPADQANTGQNIPYVTDMAPEGSEAGTPAGYYGPQKLTGRQKAAMYGQGFNNLLGAGLMAGAAFAQRKANKDERSMNIDRHGSWNMAAQNQPGGHGNYNQYGNFRPNEQTYGSQGMYLPGGTGMSQYGGPIQYANGGVYDLDDKEIARLKKLGYNIEHL